MPAESGADAAGSSADAAALLEHAELGGAYSAADTMSYDDVIEPRQAARRAAVDRCDSPLHADTVGAAPVEHNTILP